MYSAGYAVQVDLARWDAPMMTPNEERDECLRTRMIIEPVPVLDGSHRVLLNGDPPCAPVRVVSEGQYRAMELVWLQSGGKVRRDY